MRTVGFLVLAVLIWVGISVGVDWLRPAPVDGVVAVAAPDAVQTKIAVQQQVAMLTPVEDAVRVMTATGYACAALTGVRYTDASEAGADQVRGPADVLRCDPAGGAGARRWQVILERSGGRVSSIGVGVVR